MIIIEEVAQAYHASNSNPIKNLVADWEEEICQAREEFDMDLDEW